LSRKRGRDEEIVLEHISRIINEMKATAQNLDMEIDNIKRFVNEVINIFTTDSRYIKDQLLLFAQRVAELENMAYEFAEKRKISKEK